MIFKYLLMKYIKYIVYPYSVTSMLNSYKKDLQNHTNIYGTDCSLVLVFDIIDNACLINRLTLNDNMFMEMSNLWGNSLSNSSDLSIFCGKKICTCFQSSMKESKKISN